MEKQLNSNIKDFLVEKTAKDLEIDEALCDLLITWTYKKTKEATLYNNTVEISGFGKLYISERKLDKQLNRMEGILRNTQLRLTASPTIAYEKKLATATEDLEFLKGKL